MSLAPPSKEDLLRIWQRVVSTDFREGIEKDPRGSIAVFRQQAAMFADLAARIHRTHQAGFFLESSFQTGAPASSFVKATFTAQVRRTFGAHEEVILEPGAMRIEDRIFPNGVSTFGGRIYVNTEQVTWAVGETTKTDVAFEALKAGYSSNLDALLDEATGFIEEGRLVLADQSKARAMPGASIVNIDGVNNQLTLRDTGSPDVFQIEDIGIFIRIDTAVNTENVGLLLKIEGFQSAGEIPPGSGIRPNEVICSYDPSEAPVLEAGTIKWTMLDWKDLGYELEEVGVPTGGRDDELYLLGDGRGLYQQESESDDDFRQRAARLQDVVSPNAIRRAVNRQLQPFNFRGLAIDVQDFDGFFWDVDAFDYYGVGDVFPESPYKLLLSMQEAYGWFFVYVPFITEGEFGFAYDESQVFQIGTEFFGPAWDQAFFDGFPVGAAAAYSAIYSSVNEIRLGGVGFTMIRDLDLNSAC